MESTKSWTGLLLICFGLVVYLVMPSSDSRLHAQARDYVSIQSLYYRGFYCKSVQGDSRFDPANEMVLYLTVMGTEVDIDDDEDGPLYKEDFDFPIGSRPFSMRPGSYVRGDMRIWHGAAQNLFVFGAVVELDGDLFAPNKMSFPAYRRYVDDLAIPISNRRIQPNIANHRAQFSRSLKDHFASSEHDFAGADVYFIDGAEQPPEIDWGATDEIVDQMASRQFTGQVRHHFRMRFSHGGAECYAFFKFGTARKYGSWPDQPPIKSVKPSDPLSISSDHVCIAEGNRWHLTGHEVRRYRTNGSYARDGSNYTPRDPDCLFEFDIRSNLSAGGSYCVADRGKLRSNDSHGKVIGTCYQCTGEECVDASAPALTSKKPDRGPGTQVSAVSDEPYRSNSDMLCLVNREYVHVRRNDGEIVRYLTSLGASEGIGKAYRSRNSRCQFFAKIGGLDKTLCVRSEDGVLLDAAEEDSRSYGKCLPCKGNVCEVLNGSS